MTGSKKGKGKGKRKGHKGVSLDHLCEVVHGCSCMCGLAREVDKCFEPLSQEEVAGLKVGDTLWLDTAYHFHYNSDAEVNTYQSITLISEKRPKGWKTSKYFTYQNGWGGIGYVSVGDDDRGLDCDLWKLTDQKGLEALVKEHGRKVTSSGEHIFHLHY